METTEEKETLIELERVVNEKIVEWQDDRDEQKEEHFIKINELVQRIQQIKKNVTA